MTIRIRTRPPSYRLHKPTGQAVVTLNGRDHYLGLHGTTESRVRYRRMLAEYLASDGAHGAGTRKRPLTVKQLLKTYLDHLLSKHDEAWMRGNRSRIQLSQS